MSDLGREQHSEGAGFDTSLFTIDSLPKIVGENELGRLVDALAPRGDEGRDKLR